MIAPPLPNNENARLQALLNYDILDSEAEEQFDELVKLASAICEVPISLISLIDEDRQWFKARVGLGAEQTPREQAFCAHAIMDDHIMEIEDATKDKRFVNNPLVTGNPDIRFYAGMPLQTSEGYNIGTLCVIDTVPRKLTDLQKQTLNTLSKQVISQMELRIKLKEFKGTLAREHQQNQELDLLNKELTQAHFEIQASEEELRQQTEELQTINESLEAANQSIKQTQNQLIQSEKLASLGQMVAGIAHEINNPINFISGGIQTLEVVMQETATVINEYDKLASMPPQQIPDALAALEKMKQELAYQESREDIRNLMNDIKSGVERTTEIIKGLSTFARQDSEKLQIASIQECIEATLIVLSSKLKKNTIIKKDWNDDIPAIACYPGQLNQVFLNIINNAIDAIEGSGEITISLRNLPKTIEITITDNGIGMDESIKAKIFDPFFTTKKIGKGTGLGMSISYGIIQKHQGSIEVESKLNQGTTFTILLPKSH